MVIPSRSPKEPGTPEEGRLSARPAERPRGRPRRGLNRLGYDTRRDGFLFVPEAYDPARPASFAMMLHGAGGNVEKALGFFLPFAESRNMILLAPMSRERTWDFILGGFGPDVRFIDRALADVFGRYAIDPSHLAIAGFSDGASCSLSLGITNGDLFSHVIAFSPGFAAPGTPRGTPPVFISHGTSDGVLPIDRTSRRIVPSLESSGYEVTYREFDGGHAVPDGVAEDAIAWFLG